MLTAYTELTSDEQKLLLDAPALITIIVGGADDDLSDAEREKGAKTVQVRTFNAESPLTDYYEQVKIDFTARVRSLLGELSRNAETRARQVSDRLSGLNPILAQLSPDLAYAFYQDFMTLARAVARTEGGFLRWITIGPKEAKVVELPMIDPIAEPLKEE